MSQRIIENNQKTVVLQKNWLREEDMVKC